MSTQPALRSSRAAIFAAVCLTLATAGHAIAAQTAVSVWATGVGFAAVYAVAWTLTGAERSLATIMGGLLAGQFVLHSLFMAATAPAGHTSAMDHATGHVTMTAGGHGGAVMTLAHGAAAVVSAWWLRRGERAVWALARRATALASRPVRMLLALLEYRSPVAAQAHVPGRTSAPSSGPRPRLLRHAVVRRGPPSGSTAFTLG